MSVPQAVRFNTAPRPHKAGNGAGPKNIITEYQEQWRAPRGWVLCGEGYRLGEYY